VIALAVVAAAVGGALAAQADVDETKFRYTRPLSGPPGVPVHFEPDGRLYGHSRIDFPDLRVLDSQGEQVPWRPEPLPEAVPSRRVELVARGRRGGVFTVLVDRGTDRTVIDRIELEIPDRRFVGSALVQGSNSGAEGTYARLSTTPIYSVTGAVAARSTTAVFPATDYRYLLVQARGVSRITGASVSRDPEQAPLGPVAATAKRRDETRATVVTLDLGYPKVPVDAIRIRSSSPRYVRSVTVAGSNAAAAFVPLGGGEVARYQGVDLSRIDVSARNRFLRVTIVNGDDAPLKGLRVTAEARRRFLLLPSGYEPPFRLLYGGPTVVAPSYDFARLPAAATGFRRAGGGTLGPEQANSLFEPPSDTRSFFERYDFLAEGLLAVAALVVAAAGVFALRRRT
jgi:hypothetical protein